MNAKRAALLAAALTLAACTPAGPSRSAGPPSLPPPGLAEIHDPGQVTGTLTGPCHARDGGRLPDSGCTPGAIDPAATRARICVRGYTATVRPPSSQTGRAKYDLAYPAYGLPTSTRSELDHLVPLELGGANDMLNLWPEAGSIPNPKDLVEGYLHRAVCAGRISLPAAQVAIAADWETAESTVRRQP